VVHANTYSREALLQIVPIDKCGKSFIVYLVGRSGRDMA